MNSLSASAAAVVESFDSLLFEDQAAVVASILSTEKHKIPASVELHPWCEDKEALQKAASTRCSRVRLESISSPVDSLERITGCPWCRRPLAVHTIRETEAPHLHAADAILNQPRIPKQPRIEKGTGLNAYATLLYGSACHEYFIGSLVLGRCLSKYGGNAERVLLYTPDVPLEYLKALRVYWSVMQPVEYLHEVSWSLFKKRSTRFYNVFTKLRVLTLEQYDKVMLLDSDLLVRKEGLARLFELQAPAAMRRGQNVPNHGTIVPYGELWAHLTRRQDTSWGESIPVHQQGGGINAGVMLFRPDTASFTQMVKEIADKEHPEHYGTYMPEQEYLGRYFGTFESWTHISCHYNFEVDKGERIPHDFSEHHRHVWEHLDEAIVFHYSGLGCKPWDVLLRTPGQFGSMCPHSASDVPAYVSGLRGKEVPPNGQMEGYKQGERIFKTMLEWLDEFVETSQELLDKDFDVIASISAELGRASTLAEKTTNDYKYYRNFSKADYGSKQDVARDHTTIEAKAQDA